MYAIVETLNSLLLVQWYIICTKPPDYPFVLAVLVNINLPHIIIDFTAPHGDTIDEDGNTVEQWEDSNNLSLIHYA